MLREDLSNALKEAMKDKNAVDTNAIRMIIAGMKEKDVEARGKGKEKAEDETKNSKAIRHQNKKTSKKSK